MDQSTFPNLETVVLAGHSAGGQLTQRYALLCTGATDWLQFWVANPASFAWLVPDRPVASATCDGVDDYKYGINGTFPAHVSSDAKSLGRDGLVEQYRGRAVHYAFGTADHGVMDTGCQADAQGAYHLARGNNFVAMLQGMHGGMPSSQTVDYVDGVAHSDQGMMIRVSQTAHQAR